MVLAVGILFVIEVVDERDKAPGVLVFAGRPGISANRGLHAQKMFAKALALHVLGNEGPGAIAGNLCLAHDGNCNALRMTALAFSVMCCVSSCDGCTQAAASTSDPAATSPPRTRQR